jgi:hypothetical protein
LTGPGEVPGYRPKLFPAHGKEDHATLRPPPVFPARVTSSVPSQAPLEWSIARPPRRARLRTPQRTLCVRFGAIGSTASGSSASSRASQSRDIGSRSGFRLLVAALHSASVFRLCSRVRPKRVRVPVGKVYCLTVVSLSGARGKDLLTIISVSFSFSSVYVRLLFSCAVFLRGQGDVE